ncbi:hypothetical protein D3C76_1463610 [compost metagenome]
MHRRTVEQGVAQREEQAGKQGLQLVQFLLVEALVAAKYQLAQVLALVAQAVAGGMAGTAAELQAQIAALVLVGQGVQGNQALHLIEEQADDALDFQAGLQLQGQLTTQLNQAGGAQLGLALAGEAQPLQLGGIEIDGVGPGGRNH